MNLYEVKEKTIDGDEGRRIYENVFELRIDEAMRDVQKDIGMSL